jgi:hypothetical protein
VNDFTKNEDYVESVAWAICEAGGSDPEMVVYEMGSSGVQEPFGPVYMKYTPEARAALNVMQNIAEVRAAFELVVRVRQWHKTRTERLILAEIAMNEAAIAVVEEDGDVTAEIALYRKAAAESSWAASDMVAALQRFDRIVGEPK